MENEIETALLITRNSHQPRLSAFLHGEASETAKHNLAKDILRFEEEYPGGLATYTKRIVHLMEEFVEHKTKYDHVTLKVPKTVNLNWDQPDYIRKTDLSGIPSMKKCAFFLLAGGLGERLGYNGAKPCMELDSISRISFLELYCEHLKAYQALFGTIRLIVSTRRS